MTDWQSYRAFGVACAGIAVRPMALLDGRDRVRFALGWQIRQRHDVRFPRRSATPLRAPIATIWPFLLFASGIGVLDDTDRAVPATHHWGIPVTK